MKALNRSLQFFSNLKSYRTFAKYDRTFSHSLTSLACNFISCPPRIISSKIAKFHTTVIFRGKFFQEVENEYAHNIMKLLPGYAETISNHPLDEKLSLRVSDDADPESIFEKFFKATQDSLSANLSIEDSEFTGLICSITKSLPNASDEQILKTLQSLCMWPETASTRDANFKLLWNNLDEECRLRLKDWSVHVDSKQLCTMAAEHEHLVFVYGTLKTGEPNYEVLQDPARGKATYVGKAQTIKKWPLVIASRYNIPFLLYSEGKGKHVIGELYKLDNEKLKQFDELECHPKYYERVIEEVIVISENEETNPFICKPWIYFLKNFRKVLLELPFLEEYSSEGPHGLPYVPRYKRTSDVHYHVDVMND